MDIATGTLDLKFLEDFFDAWNRHDIDAIMANMTEDCIYEASSGSELWGTRYSGQKAVRAAVLGLWESLPDARFSDCTYFFSGDRAVVEWTFTGTPRNGARLAANGCDLLTIRNGKVAIKKSFRKFKPS
jgi:ketosteroid isomerase-like protein